MANYLKDYKKIFCQVPYKEAERIVIKHQLSPYYRTGLPFTISIIFIEYNGKHGTGSIPKIKIEQMPPYPVDFDVNLLMNDNEFISKCGEYFMSYELIYFREEWQKAMAIAGCVSILEDEEEIK